jgi:RNA polymerase sigma-70 factor, ECF subfamily
MRGVPKLNSGRTEPLFGAKARKGQSWPLATRAQVAWNVAPAGSVSTPQAVGTELDAFMALVRPFERAIYLVALAFVSNSEEALEIAQETVVQAFRSLSNISESEQLTTWLTGIVLREARTFLRDRKRTNCDDVFMGDGEDGVEFGSRQQKLTSGSIFEAMKELPRRDRVVLFLRDVLHLTTTESENLLGVSGKTIRIRLARARFELCGNLACVVPHHAEQAENEDFSKPW